MYRVLAVFDAIDNVSKVAAQIGTNVDTLSSKLTRWGQAMTTTGKMATAGLTIPILGVAGAVIKMGSDFEASMTVVRTMTGSSAEDFDLYKAKILDLTEILPQSANTLAQALYFVASAGFRGQEALDVLESSGKAAAVSMADVETVAKSVTAVLSAYGLEGKDAAWVTDVLTMAVIEGTAEFENFAGSLGKVLPVAAQAGVSFEQVMASMATMTRAGLLASEAGIYLRQALMNLYAPSKQASDTLEELGLSADELRESIREKGLLATLAMLMELTGGNVTQLDALIPNVRGLVAVLATAGTQSETYAEILEKVNDSLGTTEEAFAALGGTTTYETALLMNALRGIAMMLWDQLRPALLSIVVPLRGWLLALQETNPEMLRTIAIIAGLAAAIGPVLIVLGTLTTVLGALLSPIGLVVMAVAALAAAFATNFGGIRDTLLAVGQYIRFVVQEGDALNDWLTHVPAAIRPITLALGTFISILRDVIPAALNALQSAWTSAWPQIQGTTAGAVNTIMGLFHQLTGWLQLTIRAALSNLQTWWSQIWAQVQQVTHTVWTTIQNVIQSVLNAVVPFVMEQVDKIRAWFVENWGLIQDATQVVWNAIQTVILGVLGILYTGISTFLQQVRDWWSTYGDEIMLIVTTVWEAIKTVISNALDIILGVTRMVLLLITGDWRGAWEEAQNVASTIWNTIQTILTMIWTTLQVLATTIFTDILNVLSNIFASVVSTAREKWGEFYSTIQTIWQQVTSLISTKLDEIEAGIRGFSLYDAGRALINGMTAGVKAAAGALVSAALAAARSAIDAVKRWLGISCPDPSPRTALIGMGMGEGLVKGLMAIKPKVLGAMGDLMGLANGGLTFAPTMAVAGAGAGGGGRMAAAPSPMVTEHHETHLHIGVLVADEAGLDELERRLRPLREREDTRRGS